MDIHSDIDNTLLTSSIGH